MRGQGGTSNQTYCLLDSQRCIIYDTIAFNQNRRLAIKALVTGGAGFIGSNLVDHLLHQGHQVVVLDNLLSGYRINLTPYPQIRFIEGDIRDPQALDEATANCDLIFHMAASVGNKRSIDLPLDDTEVNVLGTVQVLEAARRHRVKRLIFSSSAGIFGELKTLPIDEHHPLDPDTPYGANKLAAEKLCLTYHKLYDLGVASLRYFNVYGRNQRYDAYGNVIPIFAHHIFNQQPITIFGDGEQTRDFINVRDVVQANYRAALAEGVSGVFNIASGTRISINRLAQMMIAISGRDVPVEHGQPRPGDVRDSLAEIGAAREAFGFNPSVDLATGLQEYMSWAQNEMSTS